MRREGGCADPLTPGQKCKHRTYPVRERKSCALYLWLACANASDRQGRAPVCDSGTQSASPRQSRGWARVSSMCRPCSIRVTGLVWTWYCLFIRRLYARTHARRRRVPAARRPGAHALPFARPDPGARSAPPPWPPRARGPRCTGAGYSVHRGVPPHVRQRTTSNSNIDSLCKGHAPRDGQPQLQRRRLQGSARPQSHAQTPAGGERRCTASATRHETTPTARARVRCR